MEFGSEITVEDNNINIVKIEIKIIIFFIFLAIFLFIKSYNNNIKFDCKCNNA